MRRPAGKRSRSWIPACAGLLLLAGQPGFAIFGKKSAPVPDWALGAAKTATPDYAKDAASVVLYDEYVDTVDGQGRATERHRKVTRILKPQGRREICGVAYDVDEKINYFRAWTIAADEKQYEAQDTDFVEVGDTNDPILLTTSRYRVARPPAVDVGAVVVCESEELLPPYHHEKFWSVQDDVPIVDEVFELQLPAGRPAAVSSWHRHDPVKPVEVAPGHLRWEVKDVPALTLREVPSAPDWVTLAGRMSVIWGDAAVDGIDNQWRSIGAWFTALEADRPEPSPEITAKVDQLIAGAPDFYTRISRITESIQNDVRYFIVERGIGGLQANRAADIFRNRYGDCKDKTTLLIAMLKVAGIHAVYVPVDTRRGFVDPLNPSQVGNHMIAAIEVPTGENDARLKAIVTAKNGTRYLIFDPTNERTPVGNLPPYLQGGYGILCAGDASHVIALPILDPDSNGIDRKGEFTLTADGTITGDVVSSQFGPQGAEMRLRLKRHTEKEMRESVETSVAGDVPGVVLNKVAFEEPSGLEKPVELRYSISAGQYAHSAGPLLLVRPRVVGSVTMPFDSKPRTFPIEFNATGHWHDSFDITLPPGYVVDEVPDPVKVDVDFASYRSTITVVNNKLHYERDYIVRKLDLPADKAAEFRELQGAILRDEKGTAVLKRQQGLASAQ